MQIFPFDLSIKSSKSSVNRNRFVRILRLFIRRHSNELHKCQIGKKNLIFNKIKCTKSHSINFVCAICCSFVHNILLLYSIRFEEEKKSRWWIAIPTLNWLELLVRLCFIFYFSFVASCIRRTFDAVFTVAYVAIVWPEHWKTLDPNHYGFLDNFSWLLFLFLNWFLSLALRPNRIVCVCVTFTAPHLNLCYYGLCLFGVLCVVSYDFHIVKLLLCSLLILVIRFYLIVILTQVLCANYVCLKIAHIVDYINLKLVVCVCVLLCEFMWPWIVAVGAAFKHHFGKCECIRKTATTRFRFNTGNKKWAHSCHSHRSVVSANECNCFRAQNTQNQYLIHLTGDSFAIDCMLHPVAVYLLTNAKWFQYNETTTARQKR